MIACAIQEKAGGGEVKRCGSWITDLLVIFLEENAFFRTKGGGLADRFGDLLAGVDQFCFVGEWIEDKNLGTHFAAGCAAATQITVDYYGGHRRQPG
jgi:hypothetical protein